MGRIFEVTPSILLASTAAQNDERTQISAQVFQGEPIKNKRISKSLQRAVKNHWAMSFKAKISPFSCARSLGSLPSLFKWASGMDGQNLTWTKEHKCCRSEEAASPGLAGDVHPSSAESTELPSPGENSPSLSISSLD